MYVLVINSGSSSIKYRLFDAAKKRALTAGVVEKIGESSSRIKHTVFKTDPAAEIVKDMQVADHRQGLAHMVDLLLDGEIGVIDRSPSETDSAGARVAVRPIP